MTTTTQTYRINSSTVDLSGLSSYDHSCAIMDLRFLGHLSYNAPLPCVRLVKTAPTTLRTVSYDTAINAVTVEGPNGTLITDYDAVEANLIEQAHAIAFDPESTPEEIRLACIELDSLGWGEDAYQLMPSNLKGIKSLEANAEYATATM